MSESQVQSSTPGGSRSASSSPETSRSSPGRPFKSPTLEAGFTLIEMVVVVAVIMIALGLLVPNLAAAYNNRRLSHAGDVIVRNLNLARNNAITEKRAWYVVFFRNTLQLARENRDTGDIDFVESPQRFEGNDTDMVSYRLMFAGGDEGFRPQEIPVKAHDTSKLTEGELSEIKDGDETDAKLRGGDVFIVFRPDGSVDFGRNTDVATQSFQDGEKADIQIRQNGMRDRQGWIDIRPTGRPKFKLQEVDESHEF